MESIPLNMINVKSESSNDDKNILLFKSDIDKPAYDHNLNKNIFRNNIETNTTITQPEKNKMTEETISGFNTQRLRLTTRVGTNIFKEVKGKKNEKNNDLPSIALKTDKNTLNLYEETKGQKMDLNY